jgi:hypothetical protein
MLPKFRRSHWLGLSVAVALRCGALLERHALRRTLRRTWQARPVGAQWIAFEDAVSRPQATAEQQRAGFIVFQRSILERIHQNSRPRPDEIATSVTLHAAWDEWSVYRFRGGSAVVFPGAGAAGGTSDSSRLCQLPRYAEYPLGHVLHEQQDEDVILVLRGVHAATQLIAALPKGTVEFGFFDGHRTELNGGAVKRASNQAARFTAGPPRNIESGSPAFSSGARTLMCPIGPVITRRLRVTSRSVFSTAGLLRLGVKPFGGPVQ